uniref:Uncharacterized protein n=1 Tax=viral metagenome TaxID=1070528 RepID=A0A6H1ZCY4_9ZZZZ
MENKLFTNNITLAELRDLRERMTRYRNKKNSICVTLDIFFYDHDQHTEERIIIWDSIVPKHFYFTTLREAQKFVENLEEGEK